jgi:hypothetical protein
VVVVDTKIAHYRTEKRGIEAKLKAGGQGGGGAEVALDQQVCSFRV